MADPGIGERNRWQPLTLVALVLALAALAAHWLEPVSALAQESNRFDVCELVPARIDNWVVLPNPTTMPPMQVAAGDGRPYPYSQEVAVTYGGPAGERVMLSLAYGRNQLDHRQHAHRPEYCYWAQGFDISRQIDETLATPFGLLPVRRLETRLGARIEPVTYWMTIADEPVVPGWSRTYAQIRSALNRTVPDGIVVRVSSLDADPRRGAELQDRFVRDWLAAVPPEARRLLGAGG